MELYELFTAFEHLSLNHQQTKPGGDKQPTTRPALRRCLFPEKSKARRRLFQTDSTHHTVPTPEFKVKPSPLCVSRKRCFSETGFCTEEDNEDQIEKRVCVHH